MSMIPWGPPGCQCTQSPITASPDWLPSCPSLIPMLAWLAAIPSAHPITCPWCRQARAPALPSKTFPLWHTASASQTAPAMAHHLATWCHTSRRPQDAQPSPIQHPQTTVQPLGCSIPRAAPIISTAPGPKATTMSMLTAAHHPLQCPTLPLQVGRQKARWSRPTAPVRLR